MSQARSSSPRVALALLAAAVAAAALLAPLVGSHAVPLRELFSHPTIAELAPRLAPAAGASFAAIPRAPEAESYPLSHAQRRLWVLSQLEGGSVAYNMPLALLLEGGLDLAAFRAAFARLVERHEALRTTFAARDGEPVQRIAPPEAFELPVEEVDADTVYPVSLEEARRSFDLERGPLLRARLLRVAVDDRA